ncbi:cytochrome P450-like protein 1 [Elsinoe australis]|uniref:Cytochrome P450-like protein 1 n=1 Tax=Elsinoe australis TaxID=40998 RepID=A0A4U7B555_9PEZI|nr:cytochrome P450-like protein 1 [Elsinoe australis]
MAANATALFGAEDLDASIPSASFISMPMIKTVLFAPRAILEANLRWQLIGALATVLVAAWLMEPSKRQRLAAGVPVVGGNSKEDIMKSRNRFVHDAKSMVCDGYQQSDRGMFYVPSHLGERLMLPTKYLEDLKTSPVDKVDFVATFFEMFEGRYTTMGSRSTLHPRVVRNQLNANLADVMPDVQDEIAKAFDAAWPACDDWTEVNMVDRITQVVARVSSRMFGGPELSENDEWVQASIQFAFDGFIGAQAIKKVPYLLRPIAQYFIPALRNITKHHRSAEKVAVPLLTRRETNDEKALDLLYWMSKDAKGDEQDKKFIASILLKVSFAAIHTSAAAPSQLMFDLCSMPEYIEPLRQEVESVLDSDGKVDKRGFNSMVKLDSIMKESQRHNPLLLITFERVIHEDFKLSDGFVIPAHTTIGIPTAALNMDPELYPEPEKFDGFRFEKIRQNGAPDVAARAQYAASNSSSMSFGFGRHACPGRWFAANEIKAIMAHLLLNYDFKFPPGVTERPKSTPVETQFLPNHGATIMFKRRAQYNGTMGASSPSPAVAPKVREAPGRLRPGGRRRSSTTAFFDID